MPHEDVMKKKFKKNKKKDGNETNIFSKFHVNLTFKGNGGKINVFVLISLFFFAVLPILTFVFLISFIGDKIQTDQIKSELVENLLKPVDDEAEFNRTTVEDYFGQQPRNQR